VNNTALFYTVSCCVEWVWNFVAHIEGGT